MRTTPTIMSRENLYPVWSDLSERADRARARFRDGGPEVLFRDAMKRLGFSWSQIQLEVAQNSPRACDADR